ncbi:MAG: hypothetical protein ACYCW6_32475 [Candidatus Xenobia bacterium]
MRTFWLLLLAFLLVASLVWANRARIVITGHPASVAFVQRVLQRHGESGTPAAPMAAGTVWHDVVDVSLPELDPSVIGFSDHPEKVAESGVLFWGGLLPWHPVRLLYYHEGAPGKDPHVLSLFADNPTDQTVRLHAILAAAGPDRRPMTVGHASTRDFLRRLAAQEGEVWTLGPGQMVELAQHNLPAGETVSGYAQLTLLSKGRLYYHVISRNSAQDPVSFPTVDNPADVHARGAYTVTRIHTVRSYRCGAGPGSIDIGNHAPGNVLGGHALAGDYGVTYDVELDLANPDRVSHQVSLAMEPRGGAASGTFLVDGRTVELPPTSAFAVMPIATFSMAPRSHRRVHLLTMPEGASCYPVRLIYRTR